MAQPEGKEERSSSSFSPPLGVGCSWPAFRHPIKPTVPRARGACAAGGTTREVKLTILTQPFNTWASNSVYMLSLTARWLFVARPSSGEDGLLARHLA
jgi:hypothetical protein